MNQRSPLSALPKALMDAGFQVPASQSFFEEAQAGWIPAEQLEDGQWVFDRADIPFIAGSLMLDDVAA